MRWCGCSTLTLMEFYMPNERRKSTIILYGIAGALRRQSHSSYSALEQMGIPVALTIQIDTIAKPGSKGAIIPANVASAINFYQARGPLHGLPEISCCSRSESRRQSLGTS